MTEQEWDRIVDDIKRQMLAGGCAPDLVDEAAFYAINDLQDEAMRMHYQRGRPRAEVDAWYLSQMRALGRP